MCLPFTPITNLGSWTLKDRAARIGWPVWGGASLGTELVSTLDQSPSVQVSSALVPIKSEVFFLERLSQ
jgi:hypothetical protein